VDGDFSTDVLEYALASSPGAGVDAAEGLRLETHGQTGVSVSLVRPTSISDVTYALETSTDLINWTPLAAQPTTSASSDGMTTLRWADVHVASGLGIARGIVRLRVALSGNGGSAVSQPPAWQQYVLPAGPQSLGVATLRPPLYSGVVVDVNADQITLAESVVLSQLLDPDAKHYLEVRTGSYAGHRWDLISGGAGTLRVDTTSPHNTLPTLPPAIAGAMVVIRPHVTLGTALPKDVFVGNRSPSVGDQALFYENGAYRGYFYVLASGSSTQYNHWTSLSDATLTNAQQAIIPPGAGLMMRLGGTGSRTLLTTGHVRTNAFFRSRQVGHNLMANPWPVDLSPAAAGMSLANGFRGSRSSSTADQIQIWRPDSGLGQGFGIYWLLNLDATRRYWTDLSDASLTSADNLSLLKAGRAVFFKVQPTSSTQPWLIPIPGGAMGGLASW
jgi:hypothetical protein